MRLSCALLLALVGASIALNTYDGYQVLKTSKVPSVAIPTLIELSKNPNYDFWTRIRVDTEMHIMASPEHIDILRDSLHRLRLNPEVLIPDYGVILRRENIENEISRMMNPRKPRAAVYDRYMTNDETMAFIHEVNAANPTTTSIMNVATSTEGRPVHGLRITSGAAGRKSVFIDCIIHAREWIAGPVCNKLIEDIMADPQLIDLVNWHILPIANPDGYEYTHMTDRMWRKTRRPNPGSSCVGTDPNRNFDWHWNQNNNNNYCAEDYPGNVAFSEPECAGMGNIILPLASAGELDLYVAVHAYGQLILYPWGDTTDPAPNQADLHAAGQQSADVIASSRGTIFDVGPSGASLYFTYGASDDYSYAMGAKLAYTFELVRGGLQGFNPPPSEIWPVVQETVPGLIDLVRSALATPPRK